MKRGRGFTIAEIVVVVGLFALLSVFIVGVYISHNQLFYSQSAEINAVGTARAVMDDLTDNIREAREVATSYIHNLVTYTSDSDTLVLRLPAIDSSGNPIAAAFDYVIYYIDAADATRLRKIVSVNPLSSRRAEEKLLTDYLNSIALTYNNSPMETATRVTINLVTQDSVRLNTRTITITEEVFLRNK